MTKQKCRQCGTKFDAMSSRFVYCSPKCVELGRKERSKQRYVLKRKKILKQTSKWKKANPERHRAHVMAYYKRNREKVAERKKKWRLANPKKIREQWKKWREKRKKKAKVYDKEYERTHRKERNQLHRNWVKNNKEKARQIDRNIYAKRKNAEGSFTLEEWEAKKKEFGYKCAKCKISEKKLLNETGMGLTADHIIPLSKGGTNYIANIQPLCKSCNCKKNNKLE